MQVVKGMEEALLGLLFIGDELDIIDEEQVDAAVLVSEVFGFPFAYCIDELIGELLGGDVDEVEVVLTHQVADGVEQVALAQAGAAIDEQGVVAAAGVFRHAE